LANLPNLRLYMICGSTSRRPTDVFLTVSYGFALRTFMRIEQGISRAKGSTSEFISFCEIEWNRIAHLSQSSATGSSTYWTIVKDLFACQEANRNFLLAWFVESPDNVVQNISSKDHLTCHEAKAPIRNLISNHRSPSRPSSKNCEPQNEATLLLLPVERRIRRRRMGFPPLPTWAVRSATGIVRTYQTLRPYRY
jgi:hypothetical protein